MSRPALAALLLVAATGSAQGTPRLTLRPGGTPFEGPTDFEPSALWWNPAALGPLRGAHLVAHGQLLYGQGSFERTPIDPSTGLPGAGAGRAFPKVDLGGLGYGLFAGVSWDFRLETFAFGVAALAPWDAPRRLAEQRTAEGLLPAGAYHAVESSTRDLYLAFGGAVQVLPWLSLGVTIAPVDAFADLTFYRDAALDGGSAGVTQPGARCGDGGSAAACGYENPKAAQRVKVHSDVFPRPVAIGFGVGALARPHERLWLGVTWQHLFPLAQRSGVSSSNVESLGTATVCDPGQALIDCTSAPARAAVVAYQIPDVYHLGARLAVHDKVELASWIRVVTYGGYGSSDPAARGLVVRLAQGHGAVTPEQLFFDRKLQPAVAAELGLRVRPIAPLRLGASIIYESASIPESHVTVADLDGHKLDGALALEWRIVRVLRLTLAYSLTGLLPLRPSPGAFDPSARVRCVDAAYSIDACAADLAGRAHPTAAGRYSLITHRGTVGVAFDF